MNTGSSTHSGEERDKGRMKKLPFGTNRRTVLHRWGRLKGVLHEWAPKDATCTHHTIMLSELLVCVTCSGAGGCTTTCM